MGKSLQSTACAVSAIVTIPPLGIFLIYKYPKWSVPVRITITIIAAIWSIFWAVIMVFGFPFIDLLFFLLFAFIVFLVNSRSTKSDPSPIEDKPYFDKENQHLNVPARYGGNELAYHYENVDVAGAKYRNQTVDESLLGKEISFLPEPENEHDSSALKIMCGSAMLGYVHKGKIRDMIFDWKKRNNMIFSVVSQIDTENKSIKYFIAFYKPIDVSAILDACKEELKDSNNEYSDDEGTL
ncbi:hypothetical protein [Caproicibacter fermentans]|uniref:HIRAN domain-containing protein n=1 Tax=Caproicibacter fermentans TaxID=2576756 RepID=A0A7G8TE17_9FIRM|nr:hypothetical protein [Caproicibacter fermentans]QNK41858.1 hypothetical protein HCR03_06350 [Caproicibacter fermentans]